MEQELNSGQRLFEQNSYYYILMPGDGRKVVWVAVSRL